MQELKGLIAATFSPMYKDGHSRVDVIAYNKGGGGGWRLNGLPLTTIRGVGLNGIILLTDYFWGSL